MADSGPTILVVDSDPAERVAVAAALREAGFGVVAAAHHRGARAAMGRERFAAVVIALPDGGDAFLRRARRRQPGLPALLVVEPPALRLVAAEDAVLLARPIEPHQLLSAAFELVLSDKDRRSHHRDAAECGIAAAKLACLYHRRAAATAAGASNLAQDLTRQIGETRAMHRRLASAMASSGPAVMC